jgi:cystathionine beta-synthase
LRGYFTLNVDFSLIDGFTKVTDKDAAVYTRRIALEEGILLEIRQEQLLRDFAIKRSFQARRCRCSFISRFGKPCRKMFNDDWMRERGFLEEEIKKAEDVIKIISTSFNCCSYRRIGSHAIERMRKYKISQILSWILTDFRSLMNLACFKTTLMIKILKERPIRKSWAILSVVQLGTTIRSSF